MDNSIRGQLNIGTMYGRWDNGTTRKLESGTLGQWDIGVTIGPACPHLPSMNQGLSISGLVVECSVPNDVA
jgi:hypothetical protein